jgi:prolyl oligopeptidase
VADPDDKVTHAILRGSDLYLITHRGASRSKVVRLSLSNPNIDRAEVLVPETEAVILQRGLHLAQDGLYLQLWFEGIMHLFRLPFDGSPVVEVAMPNEGTIQDIASDPRAPGIVFALESPTLARRYYKYEPANGNVRDTGLIAGPSEQDDLEYDRVTVRSRDGTLVPLTIVSRLHLVRDGSRPTLLEGYAAYGRLPGRAISAIEPLLDRGGVYAYCHARGGGEFGEDWHRGGQKENKPKAIADFIACAEYLVSRNYTSQQHLVGLGVSAGGVLVGSALAQRPDLFAAVILMVPVADLLRLEFERNGPRNVPEFGSVETIGGLRNLKAVSPYHLLKDGEAYPAVLITTGVNDRRVSPGQPAKLAARLQAATSSGNPVLLRVGWRTGHAMGATASDRVAGLADVMSFLFWQVGHVDFQP